MYVSLTKRIHTHTHIHINFFKLSYEKKPKVNIVGIPYENKLYKDGL